MAADKKQSKGKLMLSIGVVVAVVLLMLWLTLADLWGDTDVNMIAPFML